MANRSDRHAPDSPLPTEFRRTLARQLWLMFYAVVFCTLGVCIFVTRMTKKILKAIELSSNRRTQAAVRRVPLKSAS
jgi:hypothetical protein